MGGKVRGGAPLASSSSSSSKKKSGATSLLPALEITARRICLRARRGCWGRVPDLEFSLGFCCTKWCRLWRSSTPSETF